MRRAGVLVVAAICLGGLAGCSSPGSDLPGLTASPTRAATATPTPTPTPVSAGPRDLSDPALGIVFTDYPHDQDEQTAAAIETYMLFETAFWRALTTNVVPPGPWAIASDDSIAWIQAQVGPNSADGWSMTGTMSAAVSILSQDQERMTLDVCHNVSDAGFVQTPSGETYTAEGAGFPPTTRFTLVLVNTSSTGWSVDTHEMTGEC